MTDIKEYFRGYLPKNTFLMNSPHFYREPTAKGSSKEGEVGGGVSYVINPSIKFTFGEGNLNSEFVLLMGSLDAYQNSLKGPSAELLEKMLRAIGLKKQDVYICHFNLDPTQIIENDLESHSEFPELKNAKIFLIFGEQTAQTILGSQKSLSKLRQQIHYFQNTKTYTTFDPLFLLNNPDCKKQAWDDLKKIASELGLKLPQIKKSKKSNNKE